MMIKLSCIVQRLWKHFPRNMSLFHDARQVCQGRLSCLIVNNACFFFFFPLSLKWPEMISYLKKKKKDFLCTPPPILSPFCATLKAVGIAVPWPVGMEKHQGVMSSSVWLIRKLSLCRSGAVHSYKQDVRFMVALMF